MSTKFRRGVIVAAIAVGSAVPIVTSETASAAPSVATVEVAFLRNAITMATRPRTGVSYVGTQNGLVYKLNPGARPTLALDMRSRTRGGGERGLLGLTFHPTLPYAYVSYTNRSGNSRLDEYRINSNGTFRRTSRRHVLSQVQPFANHNGGSIHFGPDGYLYLGFGDGGSGGDPRRFALKLNTMLGKIIRINPRPARGRSYQIPRDNPFYNVRGAKREIWSIGLRNPWQFSFDPANGDLWIGDVGQGRWEEVDYAPSSAGRGRGVSFGWSAFEGNHPFNSDQRAGGHQSPIHEYSHDDGCSITGGVVYRGSAIPGLVGSYLFSDFCSGTVWSLTRTGQGVSVETLTHVDNPSSFGVDAAGEVYILSLGGSVRKLTAASLTAA
jgi:glucose/arabinose dehydrogenase